MTATAQLDGDELIASRTIAATLDDLWDAFTKPEHLARFWGGDHATVAPGSVTVDLRTGGAFELDTEAPDGRIAKLRFVYDEVHAPTLLIFTEHAQGIVTTVQLNAVTAGTTVIVHQRRLPPELRTPQAANGLRAILDALARLLDTHTEGTECPTSEQPSTPTWRASARATTAQSSSASPTTSCG